MERPPAPSVQAGISKETYSRPGDVTVDRGRVQRDGPGSVDVALTPDAAEETGNRLTKAATTAHDQNRLADLGDQ